MLVKLVLNSNRWIADLMIGLDLCYFFASILVEKWQSRNGIAVTSFVEIFEFPPETVISGSRLKPGKVLRTKFVICQVKLQYLTNAISCLDASLLLDGGGGR